MAIGAVVGAAAGVLKIFGGLFGGAHKKNAMRENSLLVNLVPEVNAEIAKIEQELRAGQITPDQAGQRLDRIVPEFKAAVLAGGVKYEDTGGKCNAGCVYGNQFAQKVSALRSQLRQIVPVAAPAKPGILARAVQSKALLWTLVLLPLGSVAAVALYALGRRGKK